MGTHDLRGELLRAQQSLAPALRRFFRRRVDDAAMVDDLMQDLAARLLSAELPENIASKSAFLFSVASNLVRDHHRRRAARRAESHLPLERMDFPDAAASQEDVFAEAKRAARLEREIARLPRDQRETLALYREETLTLAELAERTGSTVPRVRKLLARAIAALHARLGGDA